jgi:hypothetical protein
MCVSCHKEFVFGDLVRYRLLEDKDPYSEPLVLSDLAE